MSTLMPQGEDLRKAVKWIAENLESDPAQPRSKLIAEAALRFDLSPLDTEFLTNFFRKQATSDAKEN